MAFRTVLKDVLPERASAKIAGILRDENSNGVGSGSLTALTLTLYVEGSPAIIINSRNKQNVLNANGVTVDASGNLAWLMDPLDNSIMDSTKSIEPHVALFEWTWGGTKAGRFEILVSVKNLNLVP